MSTLEIGQRLFDFIRDAEDEKVAAIYSMIEDENGHIRDVWTDEFLAKMNSRVDEYESGKVNFTSWEQIKDRFGRYKSGSNL